MGISNKKRKSMRLFNSVFLVKYRWIFYFAWQLKFIRDIMNDSRNKKIKSMERFPKNSARNLFKFPSTSSACDFKLISSHFVSIWTLMIIFFRSKIAVKNFNRMKVLNRIDTHDNRGRTFSIRCTLWNRENSQTLWIAIKRDNSSITIITNFVWRLNWKFNFL